VDGQVDRGPRHVLLVGITQVDSAWSLASKSRAVQADAMHLEIHPAWPYVLYAAHCCPSAVLGSRLVPLLCPWRPARERSIAATCSPSHAPPEMRQPLPFVASCACPCGRSSRPQDRDLLGMLRQCLDWPGRNLTTDAVFPAVVHWLPSCASGKQAVENAWSGNSLHAGPCAAHLAAMAGPAV